MFFRRKGKSVSEELSVLLNRLTEYEKKLDQYNRALMLCAEQKRNHVYRGYPSTKAFKILEDEWVQIEKILYEIK